jgi:hypothetical protein
MKDKKYIWCFMGQTKDRPTRQKMLEELRKVSGEYFEHQTSSWSSNENLSTEEYRSIIEDSIFVPCARGNESVDTFRLYEALELGAIPIVERDDYWRNLFGDHPLITTSSEWKISRDLDALSEDKEWIKNHRLRIQNWWKSYKSHLKSRINRVVQYRESSVDRSRCTILTMSTVLDDFSRRSFDRLDRYTESNDLEHVHFEYPSSEKDSFHLLKWKYICQQLQQGDVLYIGRDLLFVGEQLNFDFLYEQGKDIVVGSQNYSDWGIGLNSNITTSFVFIKKNERILDLLNKFVFSIQKLEKDDKFYSYQEQNVDHQFELYLKQFQNYTTISNDQFAVSEEIYGKNIKHYESYSPAFINFERNVYTEEIKNAYFL